MRLQNLLVVLALVVSGPVVVWGEDFADLGEIEGYQRWPFSKGPFHVSSGMETLCVYHPFVGHGEPKEEGRSDQERRNTRIRVYANQVAEKKLTSKSAEPFPVGSVILKEKISSPLSNKPDSIGVMVKRQSGFDPSNSDWEFLFLASEKRVARGYAALKDCYDCHRRSMFGQLRTSDFVFVDQY